MSLKSQALRGISWSLADKLINQLGYLFVTIYLARLIGPESFGLIGMLTIFILLSESVVNGGFTQALVQRSKQLTEDDASTTFYINLGWGFLMYGLLYISAPWIADFYQQPELLKISRVLFLVVIINSLTIVTRAKLTINIDFRSQTISSSIATLVSSILAILLAQKGSGYWSLVFLMISKAGVRSICLWFFCRWVPKLSFSIDSFKLLFKFGSHLMLAGMVSTLVSNLYVVLIGRYYNATSVGYFSQATNLSNNLIQVISSSLQGVTYPVMVSIKEDKERLINVYRQLLSVTMLVSLPLLIGFASIGKEFVELFLGKEWLPIIPILTALCIARTVTPISSINMNILNAVGRSDLFLKVDLSKLPMTLGAIFLVTSYGIEALAWTMVCTSFIAFFINAYFPGKMFGFGAIKQLTIACKYIFASGVMFFVVQIIKLESLMSTMILKIIVGMIVYSLMLMVLRDQFSKVVIKEIINYMRALKR